MLCLNCFLGVKTWLQEEFSEGQGERSVSRGEGTARWHDNDGTRCGTRYHVSAVFSPSSAAKWGYEKYLLTLTGGYEGCTVSPY